MDMKLCGLFRMEFDKSIIKLNDDADDDNDNWDAIHLKKFPPMVITLASTSI